MRMERSRLAWLITFFLLKRCLDKTPPYGIGLTLGAAPVSTTVPRLRWLSRTTAIVLEHLLVLARAYRVPSCSSRTPMELCDGNQLGEEPATTLQHRWASVPTASFTCAMLRPMGETQPLLPNESRPKTSSDRSLSTRLKSARDSYSLPVAPRLDGPWDQWNNFSQWGNWTD